MEVVKRFENIGFTYYPSKYSMVFIKELGKFTVLLVEGEVKKGFSEYRFDFYKRSYLYDGGKKDKIYLKNASALIVLRRAKSYLRFIDNRT